MKWFGTETVREIIQVFKGKWLAKNRYEQFVEYKHVSSYLIQVLSDLKVSEDTMQELTKKFLILQLLAINKTNLVVCLKSKAASLILKCILQLKGLVNGNEDAIEALEAGLNALAMVLTSD